jgi:hypothetical protein
LPKEAPGQASRGLLKAGEDKIIRVNNDTL